nr:hypothetical protein [Tanacetum cinerariifolium]
MEDPPEDPPEVLMVDNRTMAELLQAPTDGYEDAIVIPKIAANNFELKYGLINLVQNKQFFGHDKEDPHAHIRYFNKITSTMRTNLRNEITRFQQRFEESFYEAWDRFNDLLRACPHDGFSELHQLDTFYNALNVNDQDSLNSIAGGNFLDKMPRECLKIIKSKSKFRQSRAKAVVAKVSTSSSTPAVSSEVSELKDMVRALLLDKKNQSSAPAPSSTPAPVKEIEPNCISCGGAHSYQNSPTTSRNFYRDNIQEYVSQATAANYNQGNTGFRPQMVANQIRPPGFPPHQNNFNRGNNFNQNRGGNFNQSNFNQGGNFNQGQLHRPQVNQPLAYQAPAYQAPIPQTQSVTQTDFESYIKANDAVLRNMQSQGSGTLPSNTITNLKEDLEGITTQSGVAYQDPQFLLRPNVLMPNLKSFIPYPSRRDIERRRDQANEQIEKFNEIFKDMSFEISFTDALILMPKFASTLKALIGNKEKLSEIARTLMNEHCSAVILNKLPRKLGDPSKFLIPCEFPGMDECLALSDLDRSVSKPIGIAKDVSFKVGVFHFPTDIVVVDFEPDHRVPLILKRGFLKTGRALIDVHKGELTLRIGNKAITYNLDQTVRYSANYNQMTANKIDIICEVYSQEVLGFSDVTASGNLTPYDDPIVSTASLTLTPFGDSDFLLFEEADAFLGLEDDPNSPEINPLYYDLEGDILLLEAILNTEPLPPLPVMNNICLRSRKNSEDYKPVVQHQRRVNPKIHDVIKKEVEKLLDAGLIYPISDIPWVSPIHCVPKKGGFSVVKNEENELIPTHLVTEWHVCIDYRKLNEATRKDHFPLPFMDQMLERLVGNEYYYFLDGFSGYFQIPIDPRDQEKTTFTCPYGTFAYRGMPFSLCNAPGTFQRCMLAIFHDMVKKTMEVFMDDFSVFGNSFENCISRLDKMLQRCEDTSLSLNWEKSHFMVKEGIVLSHNISKNGLRLIGLKLMSLLNYLIPQLSKIIPPLSISLPKKMPRRDCSGGFYYSKNLILKLFDTKGAENLAADHLSRLENPYENVLDPKEINETFPLETLSMVTFCGDSSTPWFADFANFHAGNFIVKVVDYLSKSVEAKALPTNDARVVCKFIKSLFAKFGSPRAIISDRGTQFCNDQFTKVMLKYGVIHCISIAYHQ